MSKKQLNQFKLFDSHFHIIDDDFPLIANQGYMPDTFNAADYLTATEHYNVQGGAIVSGSFQAFDQGYLLAALKKLGRGFVGVTQLPADTEDQKILELDQAGVKAVRFNLKRGGSADVRDLLSFGQRVFDLAGWHVELYVDARELVELTPTLLQLPKVSIDHLGMHKDGFANLLRLVEKGVKVKATGFGRVELDPIECMKQIHAINPQALMFGTDLPSTRAKRPYNDQDFLTVLEYFGEGAALAIFYDNAAKFYLA